MIIYLSRFAGFCMGVRRAIQIALNASNNNLPVFTYGPLIHNPQVLNFLKKKYIATISNISLTNSTQKKILIIRAHGISPQESKKIKNLNFHKILNGTCPRVIKVQNIIKEATKKNKQIIIIGDRQHPEVIGLLGFSQKKGIIISKTQELDQIMPIKNAIVVAQTTQNEKKFNKIVSILKNNKNQNIKIFNTICETTNLRQKELKKLAKISKILLIIGGKESGNTKRLTEIAKKSGKKTIQIENETELNCSEIKKTKSLAITTGASTPHWTIKRTLYKIFKSTSFKTKVSQLKLINKSSQW